MYLKNLKAIIPALGKNRYSKHGDLESFGDTTLLEWKIHQVKKIIPKDKIYVTAFEKNIKEICNKHEIKFLKRKKNISLYKLHSDVGKKFKKDYLIWLNPTSPFFNEKNISMFLKKSLNKLKGQYDSSLTCTLEKEYFFLNNKSVNFDSLKKTVSRSNIKSLVKITNSAYLIKGETLYKNQNLFGKKPYFVKIDFISSLELKYTKDVNLFNSILENYIKRSI